MQPGGHSASHQERTKIKQLYAARDELIWSALREAIAGAERVDDLLALDTIRRRALAASIVGSPNLTPLRVAVVGGYTMVPLRDAITAQLWASGFEPTLFIGEYDNYVAEILERSSALYEFEPNVVVIMPAERRCVYPGALGDDLATQRDHVRAHAAHLMSLVATCHERSRAEVILCNYPGATGFDWGAFRRRSLATDFSFRRAVNLELGLEAPPFLHVCDLEFLCARRGTEAFTDARGWFESKQPASASGLGDIAKEVAHIAKSLRRGPKKVLVLDLDNTLWRGVIGDDGIDGIELGDTSAVGESFKALQTYVASLKRRGVLLAVASKNDHARAVEPFERHPEMVLRMSDFVAFKANWKPKSDNIREIAAELNLGLDSFVFVDDNPAEIEVVRQFVPEVSTILLGEDPSDYVRQVADSRYFEPLQLTSEDSVRTDQYRNEGARRQLLETATDMSAYLDSLEMRATIRLFRAEDAPRIAQLINKSNQFNLTTRRRTEAEIQALMQDQAFRGFTIRLDDRFGDHGLISIVITRRTDDALEIDTWLMSCRVLMRGVEEETTNAIVDLAKRQGVQRVVGRYVPTAKNEMVRDLYPRMGFGDRTERGDETVFTLNVAQYERRTTAIKIAEVPE